MSHQKAPAATRPRLTRGMVVRMAADSALVLIALAVAVALRLFYVLAVELKPGEDPAEPIAVALAKFLWTAGPLLLVLLVVFWVTGFYTYSKSYLSRYKALVVIQAVSIGFLLFGFFTFFLRVDDRVVPRAALVIAWLLSSFLLVGARLWNELWGHLIRDEREKILRNRGPIQTVLVIGGAGYIGSALVPLLLQRNYRVRVLDILLFGDSSLRNVRQAEGLELIHGDFRNVETLYQAMQDVDAVVHLGAIVGDPACNVDEELTIDVNLISTRLIAEVAKTRGVRRLIFASTCSVYGANNDVLDERSETRPLSLYGHTKLASERVLLEMNSDRLAPTILRFATIHGLSGRTRFDLVVNLLAARARLDGQISIHGGNQWRPFIHVDDAAAGIVATLQAPVELVHGEIFNVGSDNQNFSILEIGNLVQQAVPGTEMHVDDQNEDPRNYRVSFRKIHNYLGFEPQRDVSYGIQQVLTAIANGEIVDYEDPRYSNAKYLSSQGTSKLARHGWARQMLQELHE